VTVGRRAAGDVDSSGSAGPVCCRCLFESRIVDGEKPGARLTKTIRSFSERRFHAFRCEDNNDGIFFYKYRLQRTWSGNFSNSKINKDK